MQQAVLGAPSWRVAFQLLPAASPGAAPQILKEHEEEEEEQVLKASTPSQAGAGRRESRKQVCPSRFPPPRAPLPHPAMGLDRSQHRSGQKIHLPASLARDERTRDTLLAMAAQGHSKQVPLPGAVDFAWRSRDASPTLQLKCQTSDLQHSRVLSLLSSPSLCQHGRAVEIQPPFPW